MLIRKLTNLLLVGLRYLHAVASGTFLLILVVLVINGTALTLYQVNGHSMDPTLHNGQILLVNRTAFVLTKPKLDDVVIVRYAGNSSVRLVKRIVGTPGMQVLYQGQTITIGANQYFIEGDNRPGSTDSRVFGPILGTNIMGQVLDAAPLPSYDH